MPAISQADIMNLFQLRAFDAVAREGSFTRAAARLFISQPAVTGHIKALEEHYQITCCGAPRGGWS
jgi:DNA-binding transcriptional LysR family regulator